ncbi:MAG: sodium:proton antiporter [Planctomycetota bacterium]
MRATMLGLASLLLLGVLAQWLAWRLRLPSILLLLLTGFAVGPWTGNRILDPDALLGGSLLPFVSLSVAVILFEGGLSLKLRELRDAGRAVTQLVLIGPPITFGLTTLVAHATLGVDWRLASLLGAILVVTGPTVIVPLLRHVNPTGRVRRVVLWEGIVTDPIGALLAVLIFEFLLGGGGEGEDPFLAASLAIAGGGLVGFLGGRAVVTLLRRDLVPDYLHSIVVLGLVIAAYVGADAIQHESGLAAVTVMGVVLANQRKVSIEHVVEFKENLRVLLISTLFLLLAARLPMEEFTRFDVGGFVFLVALILVVRPVAVFGALLFTKLTWKERAFVAWMAPRGIVAAAVASVFSLQLVRVGYPGSEHLVPVIFLVIVGTVLVYGLTSAPVARRLGIANAARRGVLFVGAHEWARRMAKSLREVDVPVLLVDTNHRAVQAARLEGLPAHYGTALSEDFRTFGPIDGLGKLLAVTPNDHVNALACLEFANDFGRSNVYQLAPSDVREEGEGGEAIPTHLRGRVAFGEAVTHWTLEKRFRNGALVKRTKLGEKFDFESFRERYEREGAPVVPLFLLDERGDLRVLTGDEDLEGLDDETLFAVVDPEVEGEPPVDRGDEGAPAPSG